jgi:glutaredoxin-related protein
MPEKRRATVKIMENVTDEELNVLVKGLKKIQGFGFSIDTFVILKSSGGR